MLAVAGMVLALAPAAQAALVDYEFTSNEGFTGTFTLDTANQIPSGPNFEYNLNPTSGIPLFDFFQPLNAANDFNQDDGGNPCCMNVITDGAGNLLEISIDVDDFAGTASGTSLFGEINFTAGTGQIDTDGGLALTGVQWSEVVDPGPVAAPAMGEWALISLALLLLCLGAITIRRSKGSEQHA